jgi:Domain of unknown function (DUF4253)
MPLPFEVITCPGATALEEINRIATGGRGYPVLLGGAEDYERVIENAEESEEDADEIAKRALAIDTDSWLQERFESDPEYYEELSGDWPEDVENSGRFIGHTDISSGEPLDQVHIAVLPTEDSWRVPCLLKFGGWNECPFAEEHAAMFKRWQEKYGARVVTVTGDTIEMSVERPPTTRDDALVLAREQYLYCADIVQQGTETIEALAATLVDGTVWFFWWD